MKITMKNLKVLSDILLYDPDKMKLLYKKDPFEGTIYNITLFMYNGDIITLLSRNAPFMHILSNGEKLFYIMISPDFKVASLMKELTEEVLEQYQLEYSPEAEKFIRQYYVE